MTLTNDELLIRIQQLESSIDLLKTNLGYTARKQELNQSVRLITHKIKNLEELINLIELTGMGGLLSAHLSNPDPHSQYYFTNGARPMTGNLDVGDKNIIDVNLVDGRDISVDGSNLDLLQEVVITLSGNLETTNSGLDSLEETVAEHISDDSIHGGHIVATIQDLTNVSDLSPVKNDTMIWNGTEFVFCPYNTSFTFSISSFANGQTSTLLIGSGVWKTIGTLSFSATYLNGPATDGYITMSSFGNSWTSNLILDNTFQGPTVSTETVNYPGSPGTASFTLHATDGSDPSTNTIYHNFYNYRFWGISSKANTYLEADIKGLANSELSNSKAKTFALTPGTGEYIIYAYPTRLGTATFTVGGFEGGFQPSETVSITNSAGYTENYYVYRSTNTNLGSTSVTVS